MGLNKCCCCVDLRTGAMIIAVLYIIGGFGLLGKPPITWDTILTCITCVISGACLLFGAIKYNWTATLVNLVFSAVGIASWIIVTVMLLLVAFGLVSGQQMPNHQKNAFWTGSISAFITGVLLIAVVFVKMYFWICVYSFYRNLKSGNISSSSA